MGVFSSSKGDRTVLASASAVVLGLALAAAIAGGSANGQSRSPDQPPAAPVNPPAPAAAAADLSAVVLKPEQVRPVAAVFVQDMAVADWEQPRGHWIDAKSSFYVVGSKRDGSMGPTFASFALEVAAAEFRGSTAARCSDLPT